MILLCGIRSETPLAMVAEALRARKAEFRILHQRAVGEMAMSWTSSAEGVSGWLRMGGETLDLAQITAVYLRLMDDSILPEIVGLAPNDPARRHARGFHDALFRWSEVSPARVVNRAEPQGSNGAKPYQAQLIAAHGLAPPPTLITNNPKAVLAFREEHGRIIYKSMSGVRSIVKTLDDEDLGRLGDIAWCPVQFQKAVDGVNIRVHVIDRETHATEIVSTHVDYRYAKRAGGETTLKAIKLPRRINALCVALASDLGLPFAGIDLMRTSQDEYYCLEVNPQPAFSYFEANTDQPIADSVARYLMGATKAPTRRATRRSGATAGEPTAAG